MTIFVPFQWVGFFIPKKEAIMPYAKGDGPSVVIALGGNALGNSPPSTSST